MVEELVGSLLASRDGYSGGYEKHSGHKRDKKHKHKKHKSKEKKRTSLDENDAAGRKRRSKGYDSEPESGEILTAEEQVAVEEVSFSPSGLKRLENADVDSKHRIAIKGVGNEDKHPPPILLSDTLEEDAAVADDIPVQAVHITETAHEAAPRTEPKLPSDEDGEQLFDGSTVSGPVSFPSVQHSNDATDEAVNAVAADRELQAPARDDKRSGDSSEPDEDVEGVVEDAAPPPEKKRRRDDGVNGHSKGSKASRHSRSRSADRIHHRERVKRDESALQREKSRHRTSHEDDYAERHRVGDAKHRDADRYRRDRDREHDRYGRDRERFARDRMELDRDRRKRSRSREGHRYGQRDDKRRRSTEHQEPDEPVIAPVMTEEEEQRLLEERRKRRQQILARHQQQQAEAVAVAAPTATELAKGEEAAVQKPEQPTASPQPAAPATPDHDHSTSGASEDQDRVLDIFNHPPGEVTSGPTPPVSEMPPPAEQAGEEVDDMFADDGDIFSSAPATSKAPKKPTHAAGLADAYDDPEGYYNFQIGEVMDNRYEVYESKGKGVFSTVVRARDLVRQDSMGNHPEVAIKLIRANDTMYKAAQVEQMILKELAAADPDNRKHCIRLLRSFEYRHHMCLVFEPLDMNLRELTAKYGRGVGLNVKAVGLYASQLLMALRHLKKCNVLHADIKPDNILVNKTRSKVKICDFGSAMHGGENELTPYLVSRFYRPPEVILGLKYDFAMDMWSVGCVLYELVTGQILFPGKTNNEMLKVMMDVKGAFPRKMLKKSKFVDKHFENDPNMSFALLEEDAVTKQPVRRMIVNPTVKKSFEQLLLPKSVEGDRQMMRQLADLLEKMMVLDPEKRIDPDSALRHPFVREFATRKKAPTVETKK